MKIKKFLFLIFALCPVLCLFVGCTENDKKAYISGINLNVNFDDSACQDLDVEVGYRLEFVDDKYGETFSVKNQYYGSTPRSIDGDLFLNCLCFEDLENSKKGYELKDMIVYFDINNYSDKPISLEMILNNDVLPENFTFDCEQIPYIQEKDANLSVKTQTAAFRVKYDNAADIKRGLSNVKLTLKINEIAPIEDTEGVFTYEYDFENYTATVKSYTDESGTIKDVKVPRTVVNEEDGETYTVTHLATTLFFGATAIENVYLPDTLIKIGSGAFFNTSSLKTVYMPDSIEEIGRQAFTNSSIGGDLYIPESLVKFSEIASSHMVYEDYYNYEGVAVFANCVNLKKVVFSEGIKKLPVQILYNCASLETLILPTTLEELVGYYYDEEVTKITGTFCQCVSLKELDLYNTKIKSGGYQTAADCAALEVVYLGREQIEIGYGDFNTCLSLVEVITSDCLEVIGIASFADCKKLKTITMPDSLIEVRYIAFQGCSSLEQIDIPESVEFIGDFAFNHCRGAKNTTIKLPASIKQIGGKTYNPENPNRSRIGSHIFYNCATEYVTAFEIPAENPYYVTIDGVLYLKENGVPTVLIAYPASKRDSVYRMPNTVVDAFELSMSRPYYLREIVLSDSFIIQDAVHDEDNRYCINASWANTFTAMLYVYNGVIKATCNDTNPNYKSVNGQIYSKDGKILYYASIFTTEEGATLTFEEGVERFFKGAFAGDTNQTTNQNPDNMKQPENFLYRYANLIIPASVTKIDAEMITSANAQTWNISIAEGNNNYQVNTSGDIVSIA